MEAEELSKLHSSYMVKQYIFQNYGHRPSVAEWQSFQEDI